MYYVSVTLEPATAASAAEYREGCINKLETYIPLSPPPLPPTTRSAAGWPRFLPAKHPSSQSSLGFCPAYISIITDNR